MPEPTQETRGSTAAVLFSGGSDSCLAAIRIGMTHESVHLLTFVRSGISGCENVRTQAARLNAFFGRPPETKFELHLIRTDRLCRHVMYENYLRDLFHHGWMVLSMCGLCKLSFHWRALVYGLDHGIRRVADGAVRVAKVYPEQNEAIMVRRLRALYAAFGIEYLTPIYEEGDRTEQSLFEMRFNRTPRIKGTAADVQVLCEQQVLYAMFLRAVSAGQPFEEFERRMASYYAEKFDRVEAWTREYVERGPASRLARLLEE